MRFTCAWPVLMAVLCFAAPVKADQVLLTGGDRVSGTIELVDRREVVIETAYAGKLRIARSAVRGLATERPRDIRLAEGEELAGRLAEGEDGELLVEGRAIPLASVRAVVQPEAPREPALRAWSSRMEVASSLSTGNTDARNFSARIATELEYGIWRHQGRFELARERDSGRLSKDQLSLGYGLDWFFQQDWYAGLDADYFQDPLRDVDSRITLGSNVGHQFWNDSRGMLSAEIGASAVLERVASGRDNNPALRWALEFRRFLWGKRLETFHRHTILIPTDPDRGQLIDSVTGLRMAIAGGLSSTFQVDFDFETKPAPGRERKDLTYTLGFGYEF